ncbi:hypothetical protein A2Y85_08040 [candidate division WOR-3 bacterium RBG_13_43_14]|uniref:LamG-like jellyroll fold domain-containing protein n=1 Tax=candidate division WOR-3 bacterium RBG_13_43_14 TaxID=1802590 RepID=A0A1F4U1P2_UNCW3|nr:MAG: hypothetical protein A2Y85_08040 [candidate division WOR-3 bacterium RBG_13_43_14]
MIKKSGFLLFLFMIASSQVNYYTSLSPDFLSYSYVDFIIDNPGGIESIKGEEKMIHISLASSLFESGKLYEALGMTEKAKAKYEEALTHYATADIYFHYGDCLMKYMKWELAIKSFKISLALGYSRPYLIYYNIGCALSSMHNASDAYEYLELAIFNGFRAFEDFEKKDNLLFLRGQSDWRKWYSEWENFYGSKLPRTGLVGEWLFNGNADDLSGNENHGKVHGAVLTTDRYGNPKSAYFFDQQNGDYIDCGSNSSLNITDEITVSVWIKPLTSARIIGKYDNDLKGGWRMDYRDGYFYFNVSSGISDHDLCSDMTYAPNQFYHVVGTYSKKLGSLRLYVNGIKTEEKGYTQGVLTYRPRQYPDSENLNIGRFYAYGISYFYGIIDDVRIYNRVLDEQEVDALYHQEKIK